MTRAHAVMVAGIAVVALGLGYGIAQLTGGKADPKPEPAAASGRPLPSVPEAPRVRVAVLGAAPVLPGPVKAKPKRTPEPDNGGARPTPTAAPTSAPTAAPTAAPTSAPTAVPTPVRTPDDGTIG